MNDKEKPHCYSEPFFVGRNNPRFPYARCGYLPALEASELELERQVAYQFPELEWNQRQWDIVKQLQDTVIQLTLELKYYRGERADLLLEASATKKKRGYTKYE